MTPTEKTLKRNAAQLYAWYLFYKELYSGKGEEEAKEYAKLEVLDLAKAKLRRQRTQISLSEIWEILTKYCPEMAA